MISPDLIDLPKKLFETSSIEDEPSIDQDFQNCYEEFYIPLEGKSEIDIENQLNSQATLPDGKPNLSLMKGLIHSILINQEHALLNLTRIFRSIPSSREHFVDIISPLLIHDDFHKIHFYCRKQLIWIINNITGQVYNIEQLYHLLIRNIPACRVDPLSISFCNEVVELFFNQREMIINMPSILKSTVYILLCMINDHKNQIELRKKEIDAVTYFLKADFMTCISIGREFIRVLHSILQVPEIADLWANMVVMPQRIHPNFHGIQQILRMPTLQEIFELRISFKMANYIQYLLHNVTIEQRILYVPLFRKIFLNEPEMEGFYPDLIRYLVGCQSCKGSVKPDALTRYNVIVELISQLQSMTGISDCQLALVFDWLFFQGGVDSYFNIEPAALIICNFLSHYSHVSNTLLEFLFESAEHFYQDPSSPYQTGLINGMHALCSYGVINTLDPLFEFNVDPKLKKKIYDTFKTFLSEKVLNTFDPNSVFNGPGSMRPPTPTHGSPSPGPPHTPSNEPFEMEPNWGSDEQEAVNFSPTHEDFNESNEIESFDQNIQNGSEQQHTPENINSPADDSLNFDDESLSEYREQLEKLKELSSQADYSEAASTMGELIEKILKADDLNPELVNVLTILISDLTYVEVSSETIEKHEGEFVSADIQDILTPIIDQIIKNIDNEETFGKMSDLTWKLTSNSKHLSYRILIQLIRQNEDISKAYQTFSTIISHWPDDLNQTICNIFDDLCCTSLELFDCLLPQFYRYIPECVGDLNLILIIIQNLNPSIENNLMAMLTSNRLIIFGPKISLYLGETLQWDSENQESLWELLSIELYGKSKRVNELLKEFVPFLIGPNATNESDIMIDCEIALKNLIPLIASIHPNFETLEQLFLLSHSMFNNHTYMIFSDILSIWSRNSDKMLAEPFKRLFDQILEFSDQEQEDHPIMLNMYPFVYILSEWWSMYYSNDAILEDFDDGEENNIISTLNIQEMLKNIVSKFNLEGYFPNLLSEPMSKVQI